MEFDPTYPTTDMNAFKECKWEYLYGKWKEAIPPNYPEEKGKEVDLRGYVDSNHARENKTRRFCSVFFISLSTALIHWFSKEQYML